MQNFTAHQLLAEKTRSLTLVIGQSCKNWPQVDGCLFVVTNHGETHGNNKTQSRSQRGCLFASLLSEISVSARPHVKQPRRVFNPNQLRQRCQTFVIYGFLNGVVAWTLAWNVAKVMPEGTRRTPRAGGREGNNQIPGECSRLQTFYFSLRRCDVNCRSEAFYVSNKCSRNVRFDAFCQKTLRLHSSWSCIFLFCFVSNVFF